ATVVRPYAYVIAAPAEGAALSPGIVKVRETLQRHGIKVDELREDIELDLAAYTVTSAKRPSEPFQGHTTATVEAESKPVARRIAAGSLLVRTGQPLGTLASYLLEPSSADGLATWNFFDESIHTGDEFAVLRLDKSVPITTLLAMDLPEDRKPRQPLTYELVNESDHAPNLSGSPVGIGA